ncbi:MAG: hypothetical protein ACR2PT_12470 [Endozoicomonas sp.]
MTLPANLLALHLRALLHIRSLLLVAAFLLPSAALAGLKVSNPDIQALIDKGHFMTAYQQCVNKGYTDDKEKILDFFHEKVGVLEKGIPEGAKVTAIEAGGYPSKKIEIDGISIFTKDLTIHSKNAAMIVHNHELKEILEDNAKTPAFFEELNFKLSDHLELNLVPPTEARSSRVYQLFVTEGQTGRELGYSWKAQVTAGNDELGKLVVWDTLTSQRDRATPANWLVTDSGELVAIDNAESLKQDHASYTIELGTKEETTLTVSDLTDDQLKRFFNNPETFENLYSTSDKFNDWVKDRGVNEDDLESVYKTLMTNTEKLVGKALDADIESDTFTKSASFLKETGQSKLSSRYKMVQNNSASISTNCD